MVVVQGINIETTAWSLITMLEVELEKKKEEERLNELGKQI